MKLDFYLKKHRVYRICQLLDISEKQFWRFYSYLEWDGDCVSYIGPKIGREHANYGMFAWMKPNGKRGRISAHRLYKKFFFGRLIPDDRVICHSCPKHSYICMNHTFVGTTEQNLWMVQALKLKRRLERNQEIRKTIEILKLIQKEHY